MEIKTLPPVAKNIYIECKKCETMRYCKVLAHTSSTSAKVQCEVCGSKRTFSLNQKKTTKKTTRKKSTSKKKDQEIWQALKTSRGDKGAVNYTIKQVFVDEDKLSHPKFGLGFVTKVYPNKVEVLFEEGTKELIHARQ